MNEATGSDIYSLLIPLHERRLLLPRANVAEVTGYRVCEPVANAPAWLIGFFRFEGQQIPLISFERVIDETPPPDAHRARIVLIRTLTDTLASSSFGVLTYGFPQLVRVNSAVLTRDDSTTWPDTAPVLCQLRMLNQQPLVPDVERLERMIADVLPAA